MSDDSRKKFIKLLKDNNLRVTTLLNLKDEWYELAYDDQIYLLKREEKTSEKPDIQVKLQELDGEHMTVSYSCPICHEPLGTTWNSVLECPKCNQSLNWGKEVPTVTVEVDWH